MAGLTKFFMAPCELNLDTESDGPLKKFLKKYMGSFWYPFVSF